MALQLPQVKHRHLDSTSTRFVVLVRRGGRMTKIFHIHLLRMILILTIGTSTILSLSNCFPKKQSAVEGTSSAEGQITSDSFAGATSASNKVTGVQIYWDASKIEPSAYRVYGVKGTKLTLLTTLAPSVHSFIDGSVTWGTIYSYIVRAVDSEGVEDTNTNKVSSLAWGSIASVNALSRTKIQVNFVSSATVADEVRIYIQPASGGDKTLAATVSGNDTVVTLDSLRIGYKYKVSAQAYISSLGKEDGNDVSREVTTNTLGYHDEDSSTAKWLGVMNVRAFGASPSAPVHPSKPERTPTTEQVDLFFRSFTGLGSSTVYAVTRAADGQALDTSVEETCDSTTLTSCRVKCTDSSTTMTGSGVLWCKDDRVAPSPARYRYTMSILNSENGESWTEPVPVSDLDRYSILVPIPPPNMVLVHRDAVNYEMCGQMNVPIDPTHHNRCPYTGIGAIPYNSGPKRPPLELDYGYYDFGYNLFEDRFPQACKWTRAVDGGNCGPGGTPGNCIDMLGPNGTTPNNSLGTEGNVFLALWSSREHSCYYKTANSWVRGRDVLTQVPNGSTALAKMYTSDPGANDSKVAPITEVSSPYQAWTACQSDVDPNYGPKRLPRLREWRGFHTFPTNVDDQFKMTYSQSYTVYNGGNFDSGGYRCPAGISTSNYPNYPTSVADMLSPSTELMQIYSGGNWNGREFQMNAVANVDCQSRYGAMQIRTNAPAHVSDTFSMDSSITTLTGAASTLDSGNRDLLQDINGGQTGFIVNYATATPNSNYSYYFNIYPNASGSVNFFALPLGLPILESTSSVYTPKNLFLEHYNASFHAPYDTGIIPRSVRTEKRWGTHVNNRSITGGNTSSWRCVVSPI
jgi:hypothetical protein